VSHRGAVFHGVHAAGCRCSSSACRQLLFSRLRIVAVHGTQRLQLSQTEADSTYFDVTGNSTADSTPVGGINRARWRAEAASRNARMRGAAKPDRG